MSKPDKRDFDERYSACFVDFGLKMAAGLLIGSMMGSFFLRGVRRWPMYIGGGIGFGMAYTNCENSLNSYLLSMDPKICAIKVLKVPRVDQTSEHTSEIIPASLFPANYNQRVFKWRLNRYLLGKHAPS